MSPQRHITQIFLCSAAEQNAQCVLAINVSFLFVYYLLLYYTTILLLVIISTQKKEGRVFSLKQLSFARAHWLFVR